MNTSTGKSGARQAVVLTAGMGRRLLPYTETVPKVLVEVSGRPILVRMLRQLESAGITRCLLVLGDRGDLVRCAVEKLDLHMELQFATNQDFAVTNNSYSLWMIRKQLEEGCLLIEGDVVIDDAALSVVLNTDNDASWFVRDIHGLGGAYLSQDAQDRLTQLTLISPTTPEPEGGAKSMGILSFDREYGTLLSTWLDQEIAAGSRNRYYDQIIADHAPERAPRLVRVNNGFWMEIDTPEDLHMAEQGLK